MRKSAFPENSDASRDGEETGGTVEGRRSAMTGFPSLVADSRR